MDGDRDSTGRVRLPRYGAAGASAPEPGGASGVTTPGGAVRARADGIRRLRRMSNWTAAAMLAGTAVTAVALAEHATTATTTSAASGGIVGTTSAHGVSGPQVSGPVATSGGSGVTVSTTRRVVNGHVVITRIRHLAPPHDH